MKIGILGLGYWGPKYVRIFSNLPGIELIAAFDKDQSKVDDIYSKYTLAPFGDVEDSLDAVVIATPASTHFELAKEFLNQGKHILCEKPVTLTVGEHKELERLAKERNLLLFPGFTFLYHEALSIMKDYVDSERLGKVRYVTTTRTNSGPVRGDVTAIQDLAPHDISMLIYLFGKPVLTGFQHMLDFDEKKEFGAGQLHLRFEHNGTSPVNAFIHVSWMEPGKRRSFRIVFEKGVLEFDDTQSYPLTVHKREGDFKVPFSKDEETLEVMCRSFIRDIEKLQVTHKPVPNFSMLDLSRQVTRVLEKSQRPKMKLKY